MVLEYITRAKDLMECVSPDTTMSLNKALQGWQEVKKSIEETKRDLSHGQPTTNVKKHLQYLNENQRFED
eukprot:UN02477